MGDDYSRSGESEAERLDRNYGELLQELRVAQTGVQILFAFLLGIAFQTRFTEIESYQRGIYLVTLVAAALRGDHADRAGGGAPDAVPSPPEGRTGR